MMRRGQLWKLREDEIPRKEPRAWEEQREDLGRWGEGVGWGGSGGSRRCWEVGICVLE